MQQPHIPRDKIWKATIEDIADDFLRYFYPEWFDNEVDKSRPFEFLDNELDKIYPISKGKNRRADKLIKVFLKSGEEKWVLVHIEIQGYPDPDFAERMFIYFYRLRDKFAKDISALVVYTDANLEFHPTEYRYQYLDTELCYKFATFEVATKTETELNLPNNPFSILMLWVKASLNNPKLTQNQRVAKAVNLVRRLERENPTNSKKLQTLLDFLRYYLKFGKPEIEKLNYEIIQTFKERQPMGMQELIETEYKKFYRTQGLQEGREEGLQEGLREGRIEAQQKEFRRAIRNIQKFLDNQLLDIDQIAEFLEVKIELVQAVQAGKIYLHPETKEIVLPENTTFEQAYAHFLGETSL